MSGDYTPKQVSELLLQGDVQLVDVRQPHEWEAGHIAEATHIELTELGAQVDSLDRTRPVVLVCRSGGRSAMATQALTQAGFDAHNMAGGMLDWTASGLTMEPADGHVAEP
jgi:rhodanese-related sulfurtransferase